MSHHLDGAIDRIAAGMTSGDPTPGFRTRVVQAVTTAVQRRASRSKSGLVLLITGAAAVAVAAGVLTVRTPESPTSASPALASAASSSQAAVAVNRDAGVYNASVGRRDRRLAVADPEPAPQLVAWRARAIPALATVPPIVIADIQPVSLTISPLDVAALAMASIDVAPLGGDGGGR